MSMTSKRALGIAAERAMSIIPGARSIPTTLPSGLTAAARWRLNVPGPHAMSSTRIPGLASIRSITRCRPRASPLAMIWSSRRWYAAAWRLKMAGKSSLDFSPGISTDPPATLPL